MPRRPVDPSTLPALDRLQRKLARRLDMRPRDLADGLKLGVLVLFGVAFVLWWQASVAL